MLVILKSMIFVGQHAKRTNLVLLRGLSAAFIHSSDTFIQSDSQVRRNAIQERKWRIKGLVWVPNNDYWNLNLQLSWQNCDGSLKKKSHCPVVMLSLVSDKLWK